MRVRHIPEAASVIQQSPLVLREQAASLFRGDWQKKLADSRPIQVEIGMGRGRFIFSAAVAYPDIFFVGIEIQPEMIFQALERANLAQIPPNLRLLWADAARLTDIFAPGEVSDIYLNFPDPWPKNRHCKRRLTAIAFLEQYRCVLRQDGELKFKTDNRHLFDWSLANLASAKWKIHNLSYDLPLIEDTIVTEYEHRFRTSGQPIYALTSGCEK
ncbi:MAG: tRNA (guanosine(46)-N7)-methyltransferase TrmB [Clostridiales bacterium]